MLSKHENLTVQYMIFKFIIVPYADFDECQSRQFHDCSEHAQCFNLRGTYTCSCNDGYTDMSENPLFPGRVCSGEMACFKP